MLVPIQEMNESKVVYLKAKVKHRALHEVVTRLKDKNAPAHELLKYVFRLLAVFTSFIGMSVFMPVFLINVSANDVVLTGSFRTYGKRHTQLSKAREDSKKKCGVTFKKMTSKWAESDKLVRNPPSLIPSHCIITPSHWASAGEGSRRRQRRVGEAERQRKETSGEDEDV